MTTERIEAVQIGVEDLIAEVEALLTQAEDAGLNESELYKKASTSLSVVEADGSHGIHNLEYTTRVLEAAKAMLEELLQ